MVDLQVLRKDGRVHWPARECSVPVCALKPCDSATLRDWHAMWDAFVDEKAEAADGIAVQIEGLLEAGKQNGKGAAAPSAKEVVRELTEAYGRLEERQRELLELDELRGLDEERLAALQRGIQRFATLARFG